MEGETVFPKRVFPPLHIVILITEQYKNGGTLIARPVFYYIISLYAPRNFAL